MSSSLDEAIAAMARGDQDIALSGASIGVAGAVGLAAALNLNTTVTSVHLQRECRAGGACALFMARGRCRSFVSANDIGVVQATTSVARA